MAKSSYEQAGILRYCANKHDGIYWSEYESGECPYCENEKNNWKPHEKELIAKIDSLQRDLKLAHYELKDEKDSHMATKLDVSDYLTKKKEVENLVSERM